MLDREGKDLFGAIDQRRRRRRRAPRPSHEALRLLAQLRPPGARASALATQGARARAAPARAPARGAAAGSSSQRTTGEKNPMRQVPLLEWEEAGRDPGGWRSRWPSSSTWRRRYIGAALFFREDPFLRAKARQLAEMVNAGIQPLQNLYVMKQPQERARRRRPRPFAQATSSQRGLEAIEREAARPPRPPTRVGDQPSLADICLVPQIYNARRFELDVCELADPPHHRRPAAQSTARVRGRAPRSPAARRGEGPADPA